MKKYVLADKQIIVPDVNIFIAAALSTGHKKAVFSEESAEFLQQCFKRNIQLVAPECLEHDYINAMCNKRNAAEINKEECLRSIQLLDMYRSLTLKSLNDSPFLLMISLTKDIRESAGKMALVKSNNDFLSYFCCLYYAVAELYQCPLITLDEKRLRKTSQHNYGIHLKDISFA